MGLFELIVREKRFVVLYIKRVGSKGQNHGKTLGPFITQGKPLLVESVGIYEEVLAKNLANPFVLFFVVIRRLVLVLMVALEEFKSSVTVEVGLPCVRNVSDEV